jgi:hypothetical protein
LRPARLLTAQSVSELLTVILLFALVLVITYFTTKWIATSQKAAGTSANIEVLETSRLSASKYFVIVRIGRRFFACAVSKEQVTFLTELAEDELDLKKKNGAPLPFGDFFRIAKEQVKSGNR